MTTLAKGSVVATVGSPRVTTPETAPRGIVTWWRRGCSRSAAEEVGAGEHLPRLPVLGLDAPQDAERTLAVTGVERGRLVGTPETAP